jgi:hypothetical protein
VFVNSVIAKIFESAKKSAEKTVAPHYLAGIRHDLRQTTNPYYNCQPVHSLIVKNPSCDNDHCGNTRRDNGFLI